jgi:hypothetical protein
MKIKHLLAALLATLVIGCSSLHTFGTVPTSTPLPTEAETIVIFGLKQDNIRISVHAGEIVKDRFSADLSPDLDAPSTRSYVVGKLESGKSFAVAAIALSRPGGGTPHTGFRPCGDSKVAVFETTKGKILYIGDLTVSQGAASGISITYSDDLSAAQAFVAKEFPALAGKVEAAPRRPMPASRTCRA